MNIVKDKKIQIIIGLGLALLVSVVLWFLPDEKTEVDEELTFSSNVQEEAVVEERKEENIIMKVDVKGAVNRPGVYIASDDDRVLDLIEQAGGFSENADKNSINLAQRVEDQMFIYIPLIGEEVSSSPIQQTQTSSVSSNGNDSKININTADETELQKITGVGPSKASSIVQYRTEKGAFKTVEELKEISGIGEKTFEKIKEQVTIK